MKQNRNRGTAASLAIALTLGASLVAHAQDVTPNFATAVPTATTDRYAPTVFDLTNGTHGRDNVLNIGITSATDLDNRPAGYQTTFRNTQGKQLSTAAPGSWLLTSDLWVDAAWATGTSTNLRRTDMWGVAVDATNAPSDYAIIGFTNYNPTLDAPVAGMFRGYDVNTGAWMNFGNTVNYDAWNTLAISFDAGTGVFDYFVNGALAGSVTDANHGTADASVGLNGDIMQAYNFNDPSVNVAAHAENTDYTALWSNTSAPTAAPEPASVALMATGLIGMVGIGYKKRRNG